MRTMTGVMVATALVLPATTRGQSPQFRGEPAHSGVVTTDGVERLGGVAWTFRTDGAVRSSPALHDGTLYVGSADGHLYALDAASGALRWRFDAGSPIASSPAVTGSVVMISSRDGTLHGLAVGDGRSLWRLETGPDLPLPWGHEGWDYLHSSPTVADGVVYWGSGDGYLHAIEPSSGLQRWTVRTGGRIRSTPAVSGGLVVVGGSDGRVYAVDARTGEERWTFETAGATLDAADFGYDRRQIIASPAIVDGRVYVGSRDASLYALHAADGTLAWTFDEPSAWIIASAAVDDGRVFSTRSSSGNIRAVVRETGEELWRVQTHGFVYSSPVLVGDVLYVGRGDGLLSAFNASDGEELWSYRTEAGINSTPVVHGGRIYVGSDDGRVYALAAAEGMAWRPAVFHDERLTGRSVLGSAAEHARIRDYFAERGYEVLNAAALGRFLRDRIADSAPSVVVFAMDGLPDGIASFDGGPSPLGDYLEAGGKVVWMGRLPGILVRDEETGRPVSTDRARPAALLDVDFSALDGDQHSVELTRAGREWGLDDWWVGRGTTRPDQVTEVLAVDAVGRAVAWVKSYGGPRGTGFVQTRATTSRHVLNQIRRVAEFGLARPAG